MTQLHRIPSLAFGLIVWITTVCAMVTPPAGAETQNPNFPLPTPELMEIMQRGKLDIIQVKRAGGVMGARRIKVKRPDGETLKLKWKPAPQRRIDGWNNTPRLEIAAYEVQKLVLDREDYVVPPTTTRCLTKAEYGKLMPQLEPSLRMANCVYGMLAAWLSDVSPPDGKVVDSELFESDRAYARNVANMNLVGYLIRHKDNRRGNILESTQEGPRRFFLVDNGIAFNVWPANFYSITSYHNVLVPSFPAEAIARLRKVTRKHLDALGLLVNMEVDERGTLVHVPSDTNLDPKRGLRFGDAQLQLGLTVREIDKLEKRIRKLLRKIDAGGVGTFTP